MIRMRVRRQLPRLKLRALAANRACLGLRAGQLHALADVLDLGGVPAGTVLVMEGRPDDSVYLVVRGVVEVSEAGRLVTFVRDGGFFSAAGSGRVAGGGPGGAVTVTAATALTLLVGPRDRFLAVAGGYRILEKGESEWGAAAGRADGGERRPPVGTGRRPWAGRPMSA